MNDTARASSLLEFWGGGEGDCCGWRGITCSDSTGHVVGITLVGAWPYTLEPNTVYLNLTSLMRLRELESLNLQFLNLAGRFPDALCNLSRLRVLDLSDNSFEGPVPFCLSSMRSLTYFTLYGNKLQGEILPSLCGLQSLVFLDLAVNRFYGNIPSCLGSLSDLEVLRLSSNEFGGLIPPALCNMSYLATLDLSGSQFQGNIPPCLGNLKYLEELYLAANSFKGLTSPWLCSMSSLRRLILSENQFRGNIPLCLSNLHKLESLYMRDSGLEGTIPPSIFPNLTNLHEVFIKGDRLEGTFHFSAFANLSNLRTVDISSNYTLDVDTEFPSWVATFQLNDLSITRCVVNRHNGGRVPSFLSTQKSLAFLTLSDAGIQGTVPLGLLCNSSLQNLYLDGNMLHGALQPPCRNASGQVRVIELSRNQIKGSLPTDISYSFPYLSVLSMAGNELEGSIPPLSTGLYALDLSDNNLSGKLSRTLPKNLTNLT